MMDIIVTLFKEKYKQYVFVIIIAED
jgi:hypothetical protein